MPKFSERLIATAIYTAINLLFIGVGIAVVSVADTKVEQPIIKQEKKVVQEIPVVDRKHVYEVKEFSSENFYQYLVEVNIKFPKIVMAQAILESGNFKSQLFKKHNNPFGMTIANKRPTLTTDTNRKYASYKNWQSSVLDYAMYQSRFMKAQDTHDKYMRRLGQVYAEDPGYTKKLQQIIDTLNY